MLYDRNSNDESMTCREPPIRSKHLQAVVEFVRQEAEEDFIPYLETFEESSSQDKTSNNWWEGDFLNYIKQDDTMPYPNPKYNDELSRC